MCVSVSLEAFKRNLTFFFFTVFAVAVVVVVIGQRMETNEKKKRSEKRICTKWNPKVLLAFQSFLEQEIKFINKKKLKKTLKRQRERDRAESNAHRLVTLSSNHIKRIILFRISFIFFFCWLIFKRNWCLIYLAIGKWFNFQSLMKFLSLVIGEGNDGGSNSLPSTCAVCRWNNVHDTTNWCPCRQQFEWIVIDNKSLLPILMPEISNTSNWNRTSVNFEISTIIYHFLG